LLASTALSITSCSKKEDPAPAETPKQTDFSEITYKPLDQALAASAQDGKPVFVFVNRENCGNCYSIKSKNFKDKELINLVMNNFHPVSVDIDNKTTKYNFGFCKNNNADYLSGALADKMTAEAKKVGNLTSLPVQYFVKATGGGNHKVEGSGGLITLAAHKKLFTDRKGM